MLRPRRRLLRLPRRSRNNTRESCDAWGPRGPHGRFRVRFGAMVEWRCPKSHQPLVCFPNGEGDGPAFYLCPASRLRYPVVEGVPVFLVEEATELPAAEVERLVRRARELGL